MSVVQPSLMSPSVAGKTKQEVHTWEQQGRGEGAKANVADANAEAFPCPLPLVTWCRMP